METQATGERNDLKDGDRKPLRARWMEKEGAREQKKKKKKNI